MALHPTGASYIAIPVWDIAARAYPESEIIQQQARRQKDGTADSKVDSFLQYSWGFGELLTIRTGK